MINNTPKETVSLSGTFLLLTICFLIAASARAQTLADTLQLGEIHIRATRISEPERYQPVHVQVLDSLDLRLTGTGTLDQVLSSSTSLFIKNNGPGAVSSVAQQGLSPSQTQVLWKGMPINHPMLGQVDFSILPATLFSHVEVSSGTGSSSFGGGSLGGSIYLDSDFDRNQVALEQVVGSYGSFTTNLHSGISKGNWNVGLFAQHHQAENDFSYFDPIRQQEKTRIHNSLNGRQFMFSVGWDGLGTDVSSALWVNKTDHHLPGTILSSGSPSSQKDENLRWLNTVSTHLLGLNWKWKGYYERADLDYTDKLTDIYSRSTTRSGLTELQFGRYFNHQITIKGAASGGVISVHTNNYDARKRRYRYSAQLNPVYIPSDRFRIYPALRYDHYSDFGGAMSPSLGINWSVWPDRLIVRSTASYNFNAPTFNDLYWQPGGNPDLRPERGKKIELSIRSDENWLPVGRQELTSYINQVNNGIEWYPVNNSIWSPKNNETIQSFGVDWNMRKVFRNKAWQFVYHHTLSWTHAVIAESRFRGDNAVNKQMAYIPEWMFKSSLLISHTPIDVFMNYRWISQRFTTEDHQASLDPYSVLDLSASYTRRFGSFKCSLKGFIQNLTGTDYSIIQWYPMPGRNYSLTLNLTYNI